MAETTFNLTNNQKAARKLMVTAVDVGTSSAASYEVVGAGIEDSSIEYNPEVNTVTDILGITETSVDKTEPKQTFEPFTVRGGSALAEKLYNQMREGKLTELSLYNVLVIHGFAGTAGSYKAELHKNCTIVVNSIGGSAHVDMPIEINFSNDKTLGTANVLTGEITFTPAVSV